MTKTTQLSEIEHIELFLSVINITAARNFFFFSIFALSKQR